MNLKTALTVAFLIAAAPVSAQGTMHHGMVKSGMMRHRSGSKMVAYDAKDKRYYSVAYAKSHGMHDKGGDPLSIAAMSSLPKQAKESRAMHGAKM